LDRSARAVLFLFYAVGAAQRRDRAGHLTFGDGLRGAKPLINLALVEDAAVSPRARRFDA